LGKLFGLKAGQRSKVFAGESGVFVMETTAKTPAPVISDYTAFKLQVEQRTGMGRMGMIGEQILRDIEAAHPKFKVAYLRYFNPVGAHSSGLIGEDPSGIPNNLMPYITQVAVGQRTHLSIYGGDWPTLDGTGVRDYIHVVDLAHGHLKAIDFLKVNSESMTVNLGTGIGYSVLDVVKAFEKASGKKIPYQIIDRRPGDVASCFANPALAAQLLNWKAQFDLIRMCEDSWRWQSMNPVGYN
jgi:UDP-glucose 4-epimerase